MTRIGIIVVAADQREPSFSDELLRITENIGDHEAVFFCHSDHNVHSELLNEISQKDAVHTLRYDAHSSDWLHTLTQQVLDTLDCKYYLFWNGYFPLNLQLISKHCGGERDLQLFGSSNPFFYSRDDKASLEVQESAKFSNIELLMLLDISAMAISRAFLRRMVGERTLGASLCAQRVLDESTSYACNVANIIQYDDQFPQRAISLKSAYAYFSSNRPQVSKKIIWALQDPAFLTNFFRKKKWGVAAKSLMNRFSSLVCADGEQYGRSALVPYQGQAMDSFFANDANSLMKLIDRIGKNEFNSTPLRKHDFSEVQLPLGAYVFQNSGYDASNAKEAKTPGSSLASYTDQRFLSDMAAVLKRQSAKVRRTLQNGPKSKRLANWLNSSIDCETGLDFRYTAPGGFGAHRDGWNFVLQSLLENIGHNDQAIGFDGFMEKTFVWNFGSYATDRTKPWIGVAHRPPEIPHFYDWKSRLQFYDVPQYHLASENNVGLITVSTDHAEHLKSLLNKPVFTVLHPTNHDVPKWDPRTVQASSLRVVQIGSWLRKLHSIFLLPEGPYQKTILAKSKSELFASERFVGERMDLDSRGEFDESQYDTAEILGFLGNDQYDELLCSSVVFLDLYAATANNTVLECIARHTPIVVRRLPATEEYLGADYPLFFDDLNQASQLLSDSEKILEANAYLIERAKIPDFHPDGFIRNVTKVLDMFRGY